MALRLAHASAHLRQAPSYPLRARTLVLRLDLAANRNTAGTHSPSAPFLSKIFKLRSLGSIALDCKAVPVLALQPASTRRFSVLPCSHTRFFATLATVPPSPVPSTSPPSAKGKPTPPQNNTYWRVRFALANCTFPSVSTSSHDSTVMVKYDKRYKAISLVVFVLFTLVFLALYVADNYFVGGVAVNAASLTYYATEMERYSVTPESTPSLKDALDLIQPYIFLFECSAREPLHLMLLRTPLIGHVLSRGCLSSNLIIRSSSLRAIANLIENSVAQDLLIKNLHFEYVFRSFRQIDPRSDILDLKAWDTRLEQTFYPVLYREIPSLHNNEGDDSKLNPAEMKRMSEVLSSDWNVISLVAIGTILYHLSETHPDVVSHTRVTEFFAHFGLLHPNLEALAVRTFERLTRKPQLLDEPQIRSIIRFLVKPSERTPWDSATKGRALTSLYNSHRALVRTMLGQQLGDALGPFKDFTSLYVVEQMYLPHFARSLAAVVLAAVWSAPRSALSMFLRTETVTARKILKSVGQAVAGTFALTSLSSFSDVAAEQLRTWSAAPNYSLFLADTAFIPLAAGAAFATCRKLPYSFLPWLVAEAANLVPSALQGHSPILLRTLLKWQDPRTLEPIEYDRAIAQAAQAAQAQSEESDPALSRPLRPQAPWTPNQDMDLTSDKGNYGTMAYRRNLREAVDQDEEDDEESPWEPPPEVLAKRQKEKRLVK